MSDIHDPTNKAEHTIKYLTAASIGSTTAIAGVMGVATLASSAPVLAGLVGVASTAVVAGTLYHKLTHRSDAPTIEPSTRKDAP